jgi:2-(1,2-epoxy-1,2-dihydrophenyl)acetyl-CoA isomerase
VGSQAAGPAAPLGSATSGALGTTVLNEVEAGVATITLNRPEVANAIAPDQRDAIIDLLWAADTEPAVRVVVLRAEGRHFCSGADVGAIRAASDGERRTGDAMRRIMSGAQRLIGAVLDCGKPVVAAVQGSAAGLGAHLVFACDLVVASQDALFVEPFVLRGIVVDAGGAYLLPRLVGLQRAKELAFLGEKVPAEAARELGLVNRVVPPDRLDEVVGELSARLASSPTSALTLTKRLFNRSLDGDRAAAFLEEAMAQEIQSSSHDATEGVAAFLDRRQPQYRGW